MTEESRKCQSEEEWTLLECQKKLTGGKKKLVALLYVDSNRFQRVVPSFERHIISDGDLGWTLIGVEEVLLLGEQGQERSHATIEPVPVEFEFATH